MAKDVGHAKRSGGVTMQVVRNTEQTMGPRSGHAAYARAVRRYSITTDTLIGKNGQVFHKPAADVDGEGHEVPAHFVQNDLEYVVPVKIGTPGITLNLDFDTGSADLWVWSSEVRSAVSGHHVYNPKNSTTAMVVKDATWSMIYGDGSSASGNVFRDVVTIGNVSIPNQAVELAEKLSSSIQRAGGSDGILGLAWPALNAVKPTQQLTPVENMIKQNLISSPVFTVKLDRGDHGFYTFGVIEAAKAGVSESDIQYTDVDNDQGFWMFPSNQAIVNGDVIYLPGNNAIADTGSSVVLVSDSVVSAIYSAIPGSKMDSKQGGWIYPEDATVPEVQLAVGDYVFKINAADFPLTSGGPGMLYGGVQSRGSNDFDVFGDSFFKSAYVVFDQGNVRIGVAQRST